MDNLKAIIIDKGYRVKDVMKRWNVSRSTMARIFKKPKQVHIDAINGLPRNDA